jgi:hypothetical protein
VVAQATSAKLNRRDFRHRGATFGIKSSSVLTRLINALLAVGNIRNWISGGVGLRDRTSDGNMRYEMPSKYRAPAAASGMGGGVAEALLLGKPRGGSSNQHKPMRAPPG